MTKPNGTNHFSSVFLLVWDVCSVLYYYLTLYFLYNVVGICKIQVYICSFLGVGLLSRFLWNRHAICWESYEIHMFVHYEVNSKLKIYKN